jgi:hypothetical protein
MKGIGQIIEGLEHCEGEGCRREGCPYAGADEDCDTCLSALLYDARLTLEMVRDFLAEAMRSRIMDRLIDKLSEEFETVQLIRAKMDAVRASEAEYYEDEDDSF